MSNATRWYTTREAIKAAIGMTGAKADSGIDAAIEAQSEQIEVMCARRFIPYTGTKYYRWPSATNPGSGERAYVLWLDEDLIAVTSLTKDDDTATAIAATDYFLEPANQGPPYDRIEIDRSSDAYFDNNLTPQRAIRVTGRWGYGEDTKAAGALGAAVASTSATSIDVTDASKVGVGDTLLIDSEQLFVSERTVKDTTANLNDTLTADDTDNLVTVTDGTLIKQGEVILIESEKMLVETIAGNNLVVQRAYDGSVLAAHSGALDVYAYRTLTVVRGVNGTTAATHLIAAAVSKYAPPADIVDLCKAMTLAHLKQHESAWMGQIGTGEASMTLRMVDLASLRKRVEREYRRYFFA